MPPLHASRRVPAAAAVVVLALLVVACGDDHGDDEPRRDVPASGAHEALSEFVGLPVDDAMRRASAQGRPSRVVRIDGEDLVVTMDYIEDRLNFEVENGTVTAVTTG